MGIQNAFGTHTYDLLFSSRLPDSLNEMDMFIDIEPQKTSDVNYQLHNRGIFYVGNEIVYQYERVFSHSEYDKLKKSVSIFISFDAPSKEEENSMMILNLSKTMKIGYNNLEHKDYDKIAVVVIYLGQHDCNELLLDFLRLIFRSDIQFEDKIERLKKEHHVHISESLKKEVNDMYALSDLIEKRGIEKGKFEALLETIQNLMKNNQVDEITAMKSMGIKEEDFPIYLGALKQMI